MDLKKKASLKRDIDHLQRLSERLEFTSQLLKLAFGTDEEFFEVVKTLMTEKKSESSKLFSESLYKLR